MVLDYIYLQSSTAAQQGAGALNQEKVDRNIDKGTYTMDVVGTILKTLRPSRIGLGVCRERWEREERRVRSRREREGKRE